MKTERTKEQEIFLLAASSLPIDAEHAMVLPGETGKGDGQKGFLQGCYTGKHKFSKYAFNRFEFSSIRVNLMNGNIVGVFIKAAVC